MKYTEAKLEQAVIELLQQKNYTYLKGEQIARSRDEVLLKSELKNFLATRYADDNITASEIEMLVRQLEVFPASDLYESNKQIMKLVSDGFIFKREAHDQKDLFIQLIDYDGLANIDLISFSGGVTDALCQFIITDLAEPLSKQLKVFPNPAQTSIQWTEEAEWTLFNALGNQLSTGEGTQLDISTFPTGMYFLKLNDELVKVIKE